MLASVYSAGITGIEGFLVTVECNTARTSNPRFEIVGLPDASIREAKERVISACANSAYRFPYDSKVTVNLAPADRKKEGTAFDAAILTATLVCAGLLPGVNLSDKCIVGELSLSGELRPVNGALCMCVAAKQAGLREFFVPPANAAEAAVVEGIAVYAAPTVKALFAHLTGAERLQPVKPASPFSAEQPYAEDFADVRGQLQAKRAMEIAAAGGHNILLIGPPGTGKSMLAKRLPSILPPLSFAEAIETTKIHSVAGTLAAGQSLITRRPFRAPHHTMSPVSLVGGGANPLPGEVSLAHNGVLFLDELPEFPKTVTDSLRQPLEDRRVTITRANGRVTFPCSFMLVAAMNPCRCGYYGHPTHPCTCKPGEVGRYLSRISGPLLDRMDIQIEVPSLTYDAISTGDPDAERSAVIRERVCAARTFALERMRERPDVYCNAQLDPAGIHRYCNVNAAAAALLKAAYEKLGLSARGYDRILRVARTIADLAGSEEIQMDHVAEAIQLRSLDRKYRK